MLVYACQFAFCHPVIPWTSKYTGMPRLSCLWPRGRHFLHGPHLTVMVINLSRTPRECPPVENLIKPKAIEDAAASQWGREPILKIIIPQNHKLYTAVTGGPPTSKYGPSIGGCEFPAAYEAPPPPPTREQPNPWSYHVIQSGRVWPFVWRHGSGFSV